MTAAPEKTTAILNERDLAVLKAAGIAPEQARSQVLRLRRGAEPVRLARAAVVGDGIELPDAEAQEELGGEFLRASAEGRWVHFIPASGAATRLAEGLRGLASVEEKLKRQGQDPSRLRDLLGDADALANRPKALVPLHRYGDRLVTPLEEHIREAAALAPGAEARLHFTIAPEHEAIFSAESDRILKALRAEGVRAEVAYSFQDPSTQTLAIDAAGNPARSPSGELLLRPGGHGSLLRNLEECGGEFAWIRNIDNVAVESVRAPQRAARRALGGRLMRLARAEIARPVRVCGMVPNTGEPGGAPFWIETPEGPALRIVEFSEMDASDPGQAAVFRAATHFNPVDLLCSLRDPAGRPWRLADFSDPAACFVADKNHEGRPIKALEWPGLWNGAMAKWSTHCVEIPLAQFAPFKTVIDLLRPEHRAS